MLSKNLVLNKHYRDGVEITSEDYASALEEIKAKAAFVDKLCRGEIAVDDVPAGWREEIQRRAAERQSGETDPDLTAEEALDIILGGEGV